MKREIGMATKQRLAVGITAVMASLFGALTPKAQHEVRSDPIAARKLRAKARRIAFDESHFEKADERGPWTRWYRKPHSEPFFHVRVAHNGKRRYVRFTNRDDAIAFASKHRGVFEALNGFGQVSERERFGPNAVAAQVEYAPERYHPTMGETA